MFSQYSFTGNLAGDFFKSPFSGQPRRPLNGHLRLPPLPFHFFELHFGLSSFSCVALECRPWLQQAPWRPVKNLSKHFELKHGSHSGCINLQDDHQHGPPRALGRKVGGALPQDPPFHLFDSSYNWPVIPLKQRDAHFLSHQSSDLSTLLLFGNSELLFLSTKQMLGSSPSLACLFAPQTSKTQNRRRCAAAFFSSSPRPPGGDLGAKN